MSPYRELPGHIALYPLFLHLRGARSPPELRAAGEGPASVSEPRAGWTAVAGLPTRGREGRTRVCLLSARGSRRGGLSLGIGELPQKKPTLKYFSWVFSIYWGAFVTSLI